MSGGSFDYLCFNTDVLGLGEHQSALKQMEERLAGLPWAKDAWLATVRVRTMLEAAALLADDLKDVWKAIEWWDSCDWSEEQAQKAVEEWRAP